MYFEVKQCRPRLEKLKYLLNENPYKGSESDVSPDDQSVGSLTNRPSLVSSLNLILI